MAKLILLRGNSGSGKSTVAKALQRRLGRNTMLISQDAVRREMLMVRDTDDNPAIPLLCALLHYGQAHSEYTILEGILNARRYQAVIETALSAFGTQIFAYYYDLPFAETLRRHETKPNHMDFGEADMRAWWVEKDYLSTIPETILTAELSLEDAVDLIYHAVI